MVLIKGGADVNAQDLKGRTALSLAAANGSAEVMRALLDGGANPATTDDRRWNPLMYAAAGGHIEAIHALLHVDARLARGATDDSLGALEIAHRHDQKAAAQVLTDWRAMRDELTRTRLRKMRSVGLVAGLRKKKPAANSQTPEAADTAASTAADTAATGAAAAAAACATVAEASSSSESFLPGVEAARLRQSRASASRNSEASAAPASAAPVCQSSVASVEHAAECRGSSHEQRVSKRPAVHGGVGNAIGSVLARLSGATRFSSAERRSRLSRSSAAADDDAPQPSGSSTNGGAGASGAPSRPSVRPGGGGRSWGLLKGVVALGAWAKNPYDPERRSRRSQSSIAGGGGANDDGDGEETEALVDEQRRSAAGRAGRSWGVLKGLVGFGGLWAKHPHPKEEGAASTMHGADGGKQQRWADTTSSDDANPLEVPLIVPKSKPASTSVEQQQQQYQIQILSA